MTGVQAVAGTAFVTIVVLLYIGWCMAALNGRYGHPGSGNGWNVLAIATWMIVHFLLALGLVVLALVFLARTAGWLS